MVMLVAVAGPGAGCAIVGWGLDVVTGGEKSVEVLGGYYGLADKSVAMIVSADDQTLFVQPQAPSMIAKMIGAKIKDVIPTVILIDPQQIIAFQEKNPHWNTLAYGDLIKRFEVDRLLVIDLFHFATHEPNNSHVWRGSMEGGVYVVEAESSNPDAFTYSNTVRAKYPPHPVPLLESDSQTIQLGMLELFTQRVINLFYDHKEMR